MEVTDVCYGRDACELALLCCVSSFAKSVIGLDVTRITMPIHFNEPLSFTQVGTQYITEETDRWTNT